MILNLQKNYEFLMPSEKQMGAIKERIFNRLRMEIGKILPAPSGYVVGGEGNSGELCIDVDGAIWVVYYCERGIRYNCAFFSGSVNAANYFLGEVVRNNPNSAQIQPFLVQEISFE